MVEGSHMVEGSGASRAPVRGAGRGPGASVTVVGASLSRACGVRDHAELLAGALAREGLDCRLRWLVRGERSLGGARAEMGHWRQELAAELAGRRTDAVLLHYSVFSLSHRGVPLFAGPLFATLRRARIPTVMVLHEYAYPWRRGDWRALTWALTQRAALIQAMRLMSGALVAGEERARWLCSRAWLPARRVLVAPVFSNLPPPRSQGARASPAPAGRVAERVAGLGATGAMGERSGAVEDVASGDVPVAVVGLFGYSYQGAAVALVLDALDDLRAHGAPVRLVLLGAPGAESEAGRRWLSQARARGLERALSFTGPLPAQALSDALAACDLLLFVDAAGPTPRKGTLAGSLAAGRPVVAIDGAQTWSEPVRMGALRLAPPTMRGLSAAIGGLLADEAARERIGAAGRAFVLSAMSLARSAQAVRTLIAWACADAPLAQTPMWRSSADMGGGASGIVGAGSSRDTRGDPSADTGADSPAEASPQASVPPTCHAERALR